MRYIIINDSANEELAGDIRIYESLDKAVSSLEISDAGDENIKIYNDEGYIYYPEIKSELNIDLVISSKKFERFSNIIMYHATEIGINIGVNDHLNEIIEKIFNRNPNPYSK